MSSQSPPDFVDAYRHQLATRGEEIAQQMAALADELVRDFWTAHGIAMPPVVVLLMECSSPRALADHCVKDVQGIQFRIRVAPSTLGRLLVEAHRLNAAPADSAAFLRDVLLHELVHVELGTETEPSYKGHGPRFAARCNRIGELLGLPQVAARPRRKGGDGPADCAFWPLSVRPPGWYGLLEDFARGRRRRRRAQKASAGRGRARGEAEHGASAPQAPPAPATGPQEGPRRLLLESARAALAQARARARALAENGPASGKLDELGEHLLTAQRAMDELAADLRGAP